MAKELRTYVHVGGKAYPAGSTVGDKPGQIPSDVAEKITNPKAWNDPDESDTDKTERQQRSGEDLREVDKPDQKGRLTPTRKPATGSVRR